MLGFVLDGGWMMLPLIICSIVGLAVMIDRARAFRAAGTGFEELRKRVKSLLQANKLADAIEQCDRSEGPVAATLLNGLLRYKRMKERNMPVAEIEATVSKTMEEYAPKALQGLERRLNILVLIASISPLIGMVGTVTGMMRSFGTMSETAGLEPGAVAGGIAEALITTAAGLLVAIPCVVANNYFGRRVDDYTSSIESGIADVVEIIAEV